jgi:type II secretory pathway pseudopilin PulG
MKNTRKSSKGFTLIEMTVAMMVLITAVLGGMLMILMGVTRNNTNRVDTTATNVAQAVIEQVSGAPTNSNPVLTMTDCVQTNRPPARSESTRLPAARRCFPTATLTSTRTAQLPSMATSIR